jgi:ABC-2 type transport system permease protein
LPGALAAATRLDPLTYGVDGLRAALIGWSEFDIALDIAVLASIASMFLVMAAWRFSKIQP